MIKDMIYLDYNANAPIFDNVKDDIIKNLNLFGNPSAIHSLGKNINENIESSRQLILKFFNADESKIIFTSSGTESNNLILKKIKNIDYFLTTSIEHYSVLNVRDDFKLINVNEDGLIDLEDLDKKLKKLNSKKFLLSTMLVNNENGVIQPIKKISEIVKKYGGFFHCDAAQAIGKMKIDFDELGIDAMTLSSHKFGGPIGVSGLIIKNHVEVTEFLLGGDQEYSLRSGSVNFILIPSFAKAIEYTKSEDYLNKLLKIFNWRDWFEKNLKEISNNIIIFGKDASRLKNVPQFCIPGIQSENI
ncbi:MAG: IscS-like cysteine desulfurase, partial [Alphaproteobacteria bacterium MarineAlpha8_Bin1]